MKTYRIYFSRCQTASVDIHADSPEEANEGAWAAYRFGRLSDWDTSDPEIDDCEEVDESA